MPLESKLGELLEAAFIDRILLFLTCIAEMFVHVTRGSMGSAYKCEVVQFTCSQDLRPNGENRAGTHYIHVALSICS